MTKKRKDYLNWDECFIQMSHLIAQRSKDPSTQAGAVIVDQNNIVVGLGYNGFPRGCDDESFPWAREGDFLDTKYAYVVHAEENAIYNANKETSGCKIYTTLFPCNECAKTLIQSGIKEVIYTSDKYHDQPGWIASRKMLDAAGVKYRLYQPKLKMNFETNLPR
ncbi:MAG TPA: dCMP deaminase family protein [Patescibacteria group bacterium]|nr:dCMP deaminase family protein [Patescibacteria group bacterium]